MSLKVLIVDKKVEPTLKVLNKLGTSEMDITFIKKVDQAVNNVRNTKYDLIFLGDKLNGGGDTMDVGMEIKNNVRNKHTSIICVGGHLSRVERLCMLLRPYAKKVNVVDEKDVETCVLNIREMLTKRTK